MRKRRERHGDRQKPKKVWKTEASRRDSPLNTDTEQLKKEDEVKERKRAEEKENGGGGGRGGG